MFISNFEKARIEARLKLLEEKVEQLGRSLNALHDVKTMASKPIVKTAKPGRQKKTQAERRARKNEYARAWHARKKAEKAAAAQQTVQPTQPTQE
jgi:hypothetical protein